MPGTYPRSTNPYFPFNRMNWVEEQLNLFHDLTHSESYKNWALSTIFLSWAEAWAVANHLNSLRKPDEKGSYVVVPANKTLVWCRATTVGSTTYVSPEVVAWSAPAAPIGYRIVWVSDDEAVITTSAFMGLFGEAPYLDPGKQILYPSHYDYQFSSLTVRTDHFPADLSLPPLKFEPVKVLPMIERCMECGEPLPFCRCSKV